MTRDDMTSVIVDVPAMYADHHVVEVRRILLDVQGVHAVYASSAFGVVEIDFDDEHTSAEALERLLDEAGYLSELPVPKESGEPATDRTAGDGRYRRHTTSNAPAGSAVTFRQELDAAAPPQAEPAEMKEE
jgi:copper chaperone CopZ